MRHIRSSRLCTANTEPTLNFRVGREALRKARGRSRRPGSLAGTARVSRPVIRLGSVNRHRMRFAACLTDGETHPFQLREIDASVAAAARGNTDRQLVRSDCSWKNRQIPA